MSIEICNTYEYRQLVKEYLYNTIAFLLDNKTEFSITSDLRYVEFSPELPSDIMSGFDEIVLFVIENYTFESAQIDMNRFYFEAGFGTAGLGSYVSMPILSIKQIFIDEYPAAINIIEPTKEKTTQNTPSRSMEALLSNPKNLELLKKTKNR